MSNSGHHPYGYHPYHDYADAQRDTELRQISAQEQYQQSQTISSYSPYHVPAPVPYESTIGGYQGQQDQRTSYEPPYADQFAHNDQRYEAPSSAGQQAHDRTQPASHQSGPASNYCGQEQERGYMTYANERQPRPGSSSMDNLAYATMHPQRYHAQQESRPLNTESSPAPPPHTQQNIQHSRSGSGDHRRLPSHGAPSNFMHHAGTRGSSSPHIPQLASINQPRANVPVAPNQRNEQRPNSRTGHWMDTSSSRPPDSNRPSSAIRPGSSGAAGASSFSYARPGPAPPFSPEWPLHDESPVLTVDPSQIFDHAEYMRRKEQAERDTANARQSASSPVVASSSVPVHSAAPAEHRHFESRSDSPPRDQIQSELRAMFDKIREYRFKVPNLYFDTLKQLQNVIVVLYFLQENNLQVIGASFASITSISTRNTGFSRRY
jgi:hypothetical protein